MGRGRRRRGGPGRRARAGGDARLSYVLLGAGLLALAAGLWLCGRSVARLRRRAVFSATFWSSLREYRGYRVRALGPLLGIALGLALAAAGGLGLYLGITGFYASRLLFR